MKLYAIRRRDGWDCADSLARTAEISARIGNEEMPEHVRWIRSYVVQEESGNLGTICIYEGSSMDAVREHARRVNMPATEINEIVDTVIIRPDPAKAVAAA
jgi:sporulation protein YlmC with PRC-barrel domain